MKARHSLRWMLVSSVFAIMLFSNVITGSSYIALILFGVAPFPFLTPMLHPLVLFPISIIIGTILTIRVSSRFQRPLRDLVAATHCVSSGNFSVRVQEGSGIDEVDALQRSFNHMTAELGGIELFKKDFINNFSHEFKTPIVSIRGFARQLQRDDLTQEQRREYAGIIAEEADRLANLSTSILLLSKLENQNIVADRKLFHVDEEIRSSILLLEKEWVNKELELSLELEELLFHGNAELLSHVWMNLIGNAIKFSPQGGVLSVSCAREGNMLVFSVRDEGPGMDEEMQRHIFDKFYQGDNSHGTRGYGLGLALVKRIVTICEGEVTVESRLGEGSRFTVRLPDTSV